MTIMNMHIAEKTVKLSVPWNPSWQIWDLADFLLSSFCYQILFSKISDIICHVIDEQHNVLQILNKKNAVVGTNDRG